ncbi:flagellar biosynthesis protein FlhA [Anoxybacter fermentans]|uniref:Flagellar biosynthesis protein FlhA n=1 Tax=Anoxybacter fermentans TaxID=1323375 RepID=A0A3Q9HRA0_9FIRM|nr:flagellar biosynthesis protein FlhA [Anoxybacter fermentans]AZR73860.1 flagellar biosynthesis protein FlhA [Anoxybacter fermentans]
MANISALSPRFINKYSDILFAIAIVTVVIMFIIPLPTFLLDLLLTINISFALTVLLVSIYITEPLQFSVFPSLLLFATLFRLALNVSTTRLILGQGYAGEIILSFGNFVIGGNYVVGFIIFLILVIIQFVVITKGAERVAEVAARFTLDAMPGKQMSIDADLGAGLITEEEARLQRKKIRQEADFYGAMDGASKFVKGDAIAGIIITMINVIGGLIIGVAQQGMSFQEALQTYSLLTVGDGLVSQIPALLISTATGMVVTRAASESNLGQELTGQISSEPRSLAIVAGILLVFSFVSGLPTVPFLVLSLIFGFLAWVLWQSQKEAKEQEGEVAEQIEEIPVPSKVEDMTELLQIDPMEIEVGYNLIPLVLPEQGGDFLDRVAMIRRQCALELGMVIPPIRILDNLQLDPNSYRIKLRGIEIDRYEIKPNYYLAMDAGLATKEIDGIPTKEPAFGLPALWISESLREEAEMNGYTVVDPPSVMATHLTEIIKKHASELLGRQEVKELIDGFKEKYPAVVEELIPDLLTIGQVQKVLQNLLREGIAIRDMVTILETLADYAPHTNDLQILTEYVRQSLSRQISAKFSENNTIHVITLSPKLEELISQSIQQTDQGSYLAIEPKQAQIIFENLNEVIQSVMQKGYQPIILTAPMIRYHFKNLTSRVAPDLIVLSFNELEPTLNIQTVGVVKYQ